MGCVSECGVVGSSSCVFEAGALFRVGRDLAGEMILLKSASVWSDSFLPKFRFAQRTATIEAGFRWTSGTF